MAGSEFAMMVESSVCMKSAEPMMTGTKRLDGARAREASCVSSVSDIRKMVTRMRVLRIPAAALR